MKIITMFALPLSLLSTALSQTASCPLTPTLVKNTNSQFVIDVQNTSGKQLNSYQFGLMFYDVAGQAHAFPQPLAGHIPLQAQVRRLAVWHNRLSLQYLYPLAQAYLLRATFSDGSNWSDSGSKLCSIIFTQE